MSGPTEEQIQKRMKALEARNMSFVIPTPDTAEKIAAKIKPDFSGVYHSFHDLRVAIEEREVVNKAGVAMDNENFSGHKKQSESWYGVAGGVKVVQDLYDNGWPDGATRIDNMVQKLVTPNMAFGDSTRRKMAKGDHGDEIDSSDFYAGRFDRAWRRTHRAQRVSTRSVAILLTWGAPWFVNAEAMFWRGAAAVAIAEVLEAQGYKVEIWNAMYTTGMRTHGTEGAPASQFVAYKAKAQDTYCDRDTMASAICMAGTFRFYGFRAIQHLGNTTDKCVFRSYGSAGEPEKRHVDLINHLHDHAVLDFGNRYPSNEAEAITWVDEAVVKINAGTTIVQEAA